MQIHPTESSSKAVLWSSVFVCVLCLLPASQYVIHNSRPGPTETGQVAGVATEAPNQDQKNDCQSKKQADRNLSEQGYVQKKNIIDNSFNSTITAYNQALVNISDPVETQSLQQLITNEENLHQESLNQIESVWESQKEEIDSRPCFSE